MLHLTRQWTRCLLAPLLVSLILVSLFPGGYQAPEEKAPLHGDTTSPATGSRVPGSRSIPAQEWFTENRGQVENPDVHYVLATPGYLVGFTTSGYFLELAGRENLTTVLRVSYEDSNPVTPAGDGRLSHTSSYFLGNDPGKWRVGVPSYEKVVYEELYDGIDLVFYVSEQGLKYDLVVAPGTSPERIRCRYHGAESLAVDVQGKLRIRTQAGEFVEEAPFSYQLIDGKQTEISSRYMIEGYIVSYAIGDHDPAFPLIIDPLIYSTFIGGYDGGDQAKSIALDAEGNVYIVGDTSTLDFPTTPDSYNGSAGEKGNVIVCKFNPDGSEPLFSVLMGGNSIEQGLALALDAGSNVYITGTTASADFPTTPGCYDDELDGVYDVFVSKLSSDGSELLSSTFIGGDNHDEGYGIAIDTSNRTYITGRTYSSDFPTTPGCYNDSPGGASDAFVCKLSENGSKLLYSSYLGGDGYDQGKDISLDATSKVYLTGLASSGFPTTPGSHDDSFNGGYHGGGDAFVCKMDLDASELLWSTFLGGGGNEGGESLVLDSRNNIYVVGWTNSSDFSTTPGCFDDEIDDYDDGFISKLSHNGSELIYSTFLGGNLRDVPQGVDLDSANNAWVVGYTLSEDFPTTNNALNASDMAEDDVFLFALSANGSEMVYSSYVGGGWYDMGYGIVVDSRNNIHVTGTTRSEDFPTTEGSYESFWKGLASEVFLFKLNLTQPEAFIDSSFPGLIRNGTEIMLSGHGKDDGTITRYVWRSSIDSELHNGTVANFSTGVLSPGEHFIYFKVQDDVGYWSRETTTTLTIIAPPAVHIDSLSPNPALKDEDVYFRGHGTDDGTIERFVWNSSIDGELHTGSTGNFSFYKLTNGTHTISLAARDDHGLWSDEVTVELVVNGKPRAGIELISPRPAYESGVVYFSGSGTDDGEIMQYMWRSSIDGIFYNYTENETYYEDLSQGIHTIYFKVRDDHGAWSDEVQTTLVINEYIPSNQRPVATITTPTNHSSVSGELAITGTAYDVDGVVETVEWKTDSGSWQEANGSTTWHFSVDTTTLLDGGHRISIRAFDGFAHSITLSIELEVNNTNDEGYRPDFLVTGADINLSSPVKLGVATDISVMVHNIGRLEGSVELKAYLDDGSNETLIHTETMDIRNESTTLVTFQWTPHHHGDAELIIVLEDRSGIAEDATDNNQASRNLTIERKDDDEDDKTLLLPGSTPRTVVVSVGFTGIMVFFLGITIQENLRYRFFLFLFPLYSRLSKDDIEKDIEQLTIRGRIYQHIVENPGTHFTLILQKVEAGNGTTCYHLDTLERKGFIKSIRKGRKTYYFKPDVAFPYQLKAKLSFTHLNVLKTLQSEGASSVTHIAGKVGRSVPTISTTVKSLERRNFVKSQKRNQVKMCSITEKGELYLARNLKEGEE